MQGDDAEDVLSEHFSERISDKKSRIQDMSIHKISEKGNGIPRKS